MATQVQVPALGESVKQAVLLKWHKSDGDSVQADEPLCELETEKANADLPSPATGVLRRLKNEGDTVEVGQTIAEIDPAAVKPASAPASAKKAAPAPRSAPPPPPPPMEKKKDVVPVAPPAEPAPMPMDFDASGIHRQPMSKIRKRIAQTLVQAQQTAAILTTFNEVDLTAVVDLRNRYKQRFEETYGVGLGFMSFFARATVLALKEFPRLNAFIEGDDVVYHDFVHLGIAVSTERGLAVPVLRNAEKMSFARIETEVKRLAAATREGKLALEELSGGTFTITNGGIFGSLLSTPILNPPQSGILGMHLIQKRPVVIDDQIQIRSMMYLALSYDHRLVDGRESVSFLVRLKQYLEDPGRLMLEV
ncbi:MAG: dihydrolipoyllysine-residue succinyltransferase [Tepidisphaeraceae bacterium]|jgi:2-oxoglutarate dehydrogenase E2 component (dihydrolipoamide succinyltransferase)